VDGSRAISASRQSDLRVMVIGLSCAAVSLLLLLSHALGWTPLPVALPLVAVPAAIGLRFLLVWASRSASSSRRAQVALILSWAGLIVSMGSLALALPSLTQAGGWGRLFGNVALYGWTVLIVSAAILASRTLPPRAFVAAGFAGFFGATGLSTLVGHPILDALGPDSLLATAVLIPISEELIKALPVLLLVVLASRSRQSRISAGDVTLFGIAVGVGFALYEDALYGRSAGGGWFGAPPFSLLFPMLEAHPRQGFLVSGHAIYTGTIALGLGVGVLYRRRFRWAWLAIPITAAAALLEHMTLNALASGDAPGWASLTQVLSLGGYIGTLLLVFGLAGICWFEWRGVRRGGAVPTPQTLLLPGGSGRAARARVLAVLQSPRVVPEPVAPPPPPPPPVGPS
jgi:RsiW-degrading membrane proteinase PrsW (M82 family)